MAFCPILNNWLASYLFLLLLILTSMTLVKQSDTSFIIANLFMFNVKHFSNAFIIFFMQKINQHNKAAEIREYTFSFLSAHWNKMCTTSYVSYSCHNCSNIFQNSIVCSPNEANILGEIWVEIILHMCKVYYVAL